jgi:hypothetical protein
MPQSNTLEAGLDNSYATIATANPAKVFTKDSVLRELQIGSINLAEGYKIEHFLDDENVIALVEYEYALLSKQTVEQSRSDYKLVKIADSPVILNWSDENKAARKEVVKQAISICKDKPVFFIVADGLHIITIGLLPNLATGVIQIIYMNSAYGDGSETYAKSKMTGLIFLSELAEMISQTSISPYNSTKLQTQILQIYFNPIQQLVNNCGVMTGFNIASLAQYWKNKAGNNLNDDELKNHLKTLPYSNLLMISEMQQKIQLFESYVKNRFKAIESLEINQIPTPLIDSEQLLELDIVISRVTTEDIRSMHGKLEEHSEEQTKSLAVDFHYIEEQEFKAPSYLKSMVYEIINRNRELTKSDISEPYTNEEKKAAYDFLLFENKKLQESFMPQEEVSKAPSVDNPPDIITQHISEDISQFRNLINIIDSAQPKSEDFLGQLAKIREISLKVHRNGKHIGKELYLRNKYGKIDYSTDRKRDWGIDFELIANIGLIPEVENFSTYSQHYNVIKDYLQFVKTQLELAIKLEEGKAQYKDTESTFVKINIELSAARTQLQKILYITVGRAYLNDINNELVKYTEHDVDLSKREDRYYYARVITKIGELARQFEAIIGNDEGIFRVFKKIRNLVAHDIDFMSENTVDIKKIIYEFFSNQLYSQLQRQVNHLLKQIDEYKINNTSLDDIKLSAGKFSKEQNKAFDSLLNVLFKSSTGFISLELFKDQSILTNPKAFQNLCNVFFPKDLTDYSIDESIGLLSQELELEEMKPSIAQIRPTASDEEEKEFTAIGAIDALKRFVNKCKNQKDRFTSEEKKYYQNIIDALNANMPKELKESFTLSANPTIEELQILKKTLGRKDFIFFSKQEQCEKAKSKNATDKSKKEQERSTKNSQISDNDEQVNRPNIKLDKCYQSIEKEINFIVSILKRKDLSEVKLTYAIEFVIAKIGQMHSNIRQFKLDAHLEFKMPVQYQVSARKTSQKRNEIMHQGYKKNEDLSNTLLLYRHILPTHDQIKALNLIMSKTQKFENYIFKEDHSADLLDLAQAYAKIEDFEKAFSFLKLILILKNVPIIDEDLGKTAIKYLENESNQISNIVCDCLFLCAIFLGKRAEVFLKNNQLEKAKPFYELKIQIIKLIKKLDLDKPDIQASLMSNIASSHNLIQEYDQALKFAQESFRDYLDSKNENLEIKILNMANLAFAYHKVYCSIDIKKLTTQYQVDKAYHYASLALAASYYVKKLYIIHQKEKDEYYVKLTAIIAKLALFKGRKILAKHSLEESKELSKSIPMYEDNYALMMVKEGEEICNKNIEDPYYTYARDMDTYLLLFDFEHIIFLKQFFDYNELEYDLSKDIKDVYHQLQNRKLNEADKNKVEFTYKNILGYIHGCNGEHKEALKQYFSALALNQEQSPYIMAPMYGDIGNAYFELKNYNMALKNFVLSVKYYAQGFPEKPALFVIPWRILQCLINGGNYQNLIIELKKARDLIDKKLNSEDKHFLNNINQLIYSISTDHSAMPASKCPGNQLALYYQESYRLAEHYVTYYGSSIDTLLSLRIKDTELSNVAILQASFLNENTIPHLLGNALNKIQTGFNKVVLPFNIDSKHWVGLVIEANDNHLDIKYLDSENKEMPLNAREALYIACAQKGYQAALQTVMVEEQKYSNCGPELIENFVMVLTGNRATQEAAVPLHSLLYENSVLDAEASALQLVENSRMIEQLSNRKTPLYRMETLDHKVNALITYYASKPQAYKATTDSDRFTNLFQKILEQTNTKLDSCFKYVSTFFKPNSYTELQILADKYDVNVKVIDAHSARIAYKKIAIKTHPDKVGGNTEDFRLAKVLSEQTSEISVNYNQIMSNLDQSHTVVRAVRTLTDMVKIYNEPEQVNIISTLANCGYLVESLTSNPIGIKYFSGLAIGYQLYEGDYRGALTSAATFVIYTAPVALMPSAPALAVTLKAGFIAYDAYYAVPELYHELKEAGAFEIFSSAHI